MPYLPLVLLVDDDAAARFLTQRLLRPYADQVRVLEAGNGQEALDVLDQQPPSSGPTLVLLDLNMPVMNGLAFLEYAHHIWLPTRRTATKIVLVSSTERVSEQQQAAALGAAFEPKPLTAGALAKVLQQQLGAALAN